MEQCVMTTGTTKMPQSSAHNWVFLTMVNQSCHSVSSLFLKDVNSFQCFSSPLFSLPTDFYVQTVVLALSSSLLISLIFLLCLSHIAFHVLF